jgi:hypothetical protein
VILRSSNARCILPKSWKSQRITILPSASSPNSSKPKSINSDTIRQWNFNGPNPVMEYYDKSGKLINKEYFKNMNDFAKGKKIQPLTK